MRTAPFEKPVAFVFFVMLAQLAALALRSLAQVSLQDRGMARELAANFSYPIVPVVLTVLLWPHLRTRRDDICAWFARPRSWCRVVTVGVLLGILARGAGWGVIFALAAFGVHGYAPTGFGSELFYVFSCPPAAHILLAILSACVLVPLAEESVNRGLLLHALLPSGKPVAISLSASLFMILHDPSGMPAAFAIGIAFALLALRCQSLVPGVIAHATYNLLRVFDWYCAKLTWHPETLSGETGLVGLLASSFAVLCFVCAAYLVLQADAGTQTVPAPGSR